MTNLTLPVWPQTINIFFLYYKVRLMLDDWPFGGFMCSFVPFTQSVSVFVSSFTMTAIAVDRYQVISTTLLHQRAEFRDGYWKLAVIWTVSILLSVPWAVYHSVKPTFTCKTLHRCQVRQCNGDGRKIEPQYPLF